MKNEWEGEKCNASIMNNHVRRNAQQKQTNKRKNNKTKLSYPKHIYKHGSTPARRHRHRSEQNELYHLLSSFNANKEEKCQLTSARLYFPLLIHEYH